MAKSLKDLLKGLDNASEIEKQIRANLQAESCKLFIDDGEENIYIPKHRLDEKIKELKSAQSTIDSLNTSVKELQGKVDSGEDSQTTIKELKGKIKQYEQSVKDVKIASALELLALENKAKDKNDLKAFLDLSKVTINEAGEVGGLKEQVEALKANKSYLFEDVSEPSNNLGGFFGGTGIPGKPSNETIFGSKTTHEGDFGKALAQMNNSNGNEGKEIDSDYFFK